MFQFALLALMLVGCCHSPECIHHHRALDKEQKNALPESYKKDIKFKIMQNENSSSTMRGKSLGSV